jgi:hypothetical protein
MTLAKIMILSAVLGLLPGVAHAKPKRDCSWHYSPSGICVRKCEKSKCVRKPGVVCRQEVDAAGRVKAVCK